MPPAPNSQQQQSHAGKRPWVGPLPTPRANYAKNRVTRTIPSNPRAMPTNANRAHVPESTPACFLAARRAPYEHRSPGCAVQVVSITQNSDPDKTSASPAKTVINTAGKSSRRPGSRQQSIQRCHLLTGNVGSVRCTFRSPRPRSRWAPVRPYQQMLGPSADKIGVIRRAPNRPN
jgi:hypothetical protein